MANGDPGSYQFRVSSFTNRASFYNGGGAPLGTFTVKSYLSDLVYLIEQIDTVTVTNTQAGTITSASASVNSVLLNSPVTYTLTFTPINTIVW